MGFSLPQLMMLRARGGAVTRKPAKRCIVLFAWGGLSHLDTFDPKPNAPADIRGEFNNIATTVPGIRIGEHTPLLARQMHRMAVVRSVTHQAPSHRSAAYWNLTGHPPPNLTGNWEATRNDHPCLGSLTFAGLRAAEDPRLAGSILQAPVSLPYTMADGGRANGQDGGFLGLKYDPIIVRPKGGKLYDGVSPTSGSLALDLPAGVNAERVAGLRGLTEEIEKQNSFGVTSDTEAYSLARDQACELLLDQRVRDAFNLELEPVVLREKYGEHICGQSVLMARRLAEAGVPMVTVYCAAGDLNGSVGEHFDTHADNFNRLKNSMLPPLDRASSALIEDLYQRGTLDETLVCWLTEFGRTPRINGSAGRDHFPSCYSVAFAGGGVAGGQVYGKSDAIGFYPEEAPCSPEDLHATIFRALGIDPGTIIQSPDGRPFPLSTGTALNIFG